MCMFYFTFLRKKVKSIVAFDIESQYSAVSATVKLSRNCVRVFYDLLRDIGSCPRYVHCAENYASEPRLPRDVRLSLSFRATGNVYTNNLNKIIFDVSHLFFFSE